MNIPIVDIDTGECGWCEKGDKEVIHLRKEGQVDSKLCARCMTKFLKMQKAAGKSKGETPLFQAG